MDSIQNEKSYGTLIVQAEGGSGAFPVRDAAVHIRLAHEDGTSDLLHALKTDESGRTPPVRIDTPAPAESLAPGGKTPYTEISAEISLPGYYTTIIEGIPVYPGITSIQPVRMVPIPTAANNTPFPNDTILINEAGAPPAL